MTTIQLECLWSYIQSLNLSRRSRTWLSNKLIECPTTDTTAADKEEEYISKKEVLAGIDAGLKDLKAGRTMSFDDFLKEVENRN